MLVAARLDDGIIQKLWELRLVSSVVGSGQKAAQELSDDDRGHPEPVGPVDQLCDPRMA